jgi:hypothetical protein
MEDERERVVSSPTEAGSAEERMLGNLCTSDSI